MHLGISYPYFEDVGERIIFLFKGKITHNEDYFPTFEGRQEDDLAFKMNDSLNIRSFTNPNFEVKRIQYSDKGYYLLDNI